MARPIRKTSLLSIYSLLVLLMMGMAGCENDVIDEGTNNGAREANALLQVTTRGTGEATVSYPVQVYVFQGEECKAVQSIGDAGQTLNIPLVEGTYSIYAIGGTSSTDYNLPALSDATTTTAITLKEGKSLTDLMAAHATVTLEDGEANTVTLGLERKVMLLQDVTIKKVPTAATAVSVVIAPLWQSLCLGGTYSTANSSATIALTRQSDGRTWQNAASAYLLPPSDSPASITVKITTAAGTKSYTYSTADQLAAGYKINIDGTYTEAVGVSLTGTITGATWLGERTISFTFDESGSTAAENNTDPTPDPSPTGAGSFPAVGDTYEGCYVLAVTEIDETSAELTLLSPNEQAVASASDADAALATLGMDGISDWAIPTKAQMDAFYAAKDGVTPAPAGTYYIWQGSTSLKKRNMSTGDDSSFASGAYLRPVAVVSVTTE